MDLCYFCKESGSPTCLRKTFQGQGEILAPNKPGTLVYCTQVPTSLPSGAPDEELVYTGNPPPGYHRILDSMSFLPAEDHPLEGGAVIPSPKDDSMSDG